MTIAKITIIGSGFRGLWLAQELVKNKFEVTWLSLQDEVSGLAQKLPWQVGSSKSFEKLEESQKAFFKNNFKYQIQDRFQVLSKNQMIDCSKHLAKNSFENVFAESSDLLFRLFTAYHADDHNLYAAIKSKLEQKPKQSKWVLDVVEGYRRSELLDIFSDLMLFEDHYDVILKNIIDQTQKSGVTVLRDAELNDIGKDGNKITGIEVKNSTAFRPCDQLVLACSVPLLFKKQPGLKEHFDFLNVNTQEPDKVWVEVKLKVKKHSRPQGLEEFFSFVVDPLMPFTDGQFGLARWQDTVLQVWCLVPFKETKKQSFYFGLQAKVKNSLALVLESFEDSFEEYISENQQLNLETVQFEFSQQQEHSLYKGLCKKNLWIAGEETDVGLEFFAMLKTEQQILKNILMHYRKEIARDRKIHASPDGKSMAAGV